MKFSGEVWRTLALITQLGISMLTPIFLMMFLGLWIDQKFSTNFVIIFILLGIGGGFRSVYTIIKKAGGNSKKNEKNKDIY